MDSQEQKEQLDPKVHEEIAKVISKDPNDLTPSDKAFLRARQSYIGRNARRKFADALAEEPEVTPETPSVAPKEVDNSKHPADEAQAKTQASDEDDVE